MEIIKIYFSVYGDMQTFILDLTVLISIYATLKAIQKIDSLLAFTTIPFYIAFILSFPPYSYYRHFYYFVYSVLAYTYSCVNQFLCSLFSHISIFSYDIFLSYSF